MKTWVYLVGEEKRECLEHELFQKKATGEIKDDTYVWTEGMKNWILFSEMQAELTPDLQQPEVNSHVQGQPVVNPHVQGQPVVNPYMQGQPVVNPYMQGQPVVNPYVQGQPVVNPYMQGQPMANPYMQGQPVANPYMQGQPVANPYMQGQPVTNPYMQGQPVTNPYMQGPPVVNPYVTSAKDAQFEEPKIVEFPRVKPLDFWKFIVSFLGIPLSCVIMYFIVSSLDLKSEAVIVLIVITFLPFLVWFYMLYCDVIRQMCLIVNAVSGVQEKKSPTAMVLLAVIPVVNVVGNFFVFPGMARRWEAFRLARPGQGIPEFKEQYSWIFSIAPPSCILLSAIGGREVGNLLNLAITVMAFSMIYRMCKIINFVSKQSAKKIKPKRLAVVLK